MKLAKNRPTPREPVTGPNLGNPPGPATLVVGAGGLLGTSLTRVLRERRDGGERGDGTVLTSTVGWTSAHEQSDLADGLGVTVNQMAAMALVPICQAHLAGRYGADPSRLATVLDA